MRHMNQHMHPEITHKIAFVTNTGKGIATRCVGTLKRKDAKTATSVRLSTSY